MATSRQIIAVVSAALATTTTAVNHVFFAEVYAHVTARHETVLQDMRALSKGNAFILSEQVDLQSVLSTNFEGNVAHLNTTLQAPAVTPGEVVYCKRRFTAPPPDPVTLPTPLL